MSESRKPTADATERCRKIFAAAWPASYNRSGLGQSPFQLVSHSFFLTLGEVPVVVKFQCAKCRKAFKVDSKHAGKQTKCPDCGAALRIPSLEQIQTAQAKRAEPAEEAKQPVSAAATTATASSPQRPPATADLPSDDVRTSAVQPTVEGQPGVDPFGTQQESAAGSSYAGIGQRGVALVVDVAIVLAAWMGANFVVAGLLFIVGVRDLPLLIQLPLLAILLTIPWLYHAKLESSVMQATVGKWILRIRVTDVQGNRIGFGRATGRYFGKWLSYWLLCVGFVAAAFTRKQQALHDLMANTLGSVPKLIFDVSGASAMLGG